MYPDILQDLIESNFRRSIDAKTGKIILIPIPDATHSLDSLESLAKRISCDIIPPATHSLDSLESLENQLWSFDGKPVLQLMPSMRSFETVIPLIPLMMIMSIFGMLFIGTGVVALTINSVAIWLPFINLGIGVVMVGISIVSLTNSLWQQMQPR
jgi:hypothetical protein